jgi:hypothetical protein
LSDRSRGFPFFLKTIGIDFKSPGEWGVGEEITVYGLFFLSFLGVIAKDVGLLGIFRGDDVLDDGIGVWEVLKFGVGGVRGGGL